MAVCESSQQSQQDQFSQSVLTLGKMSPWIGAPYFVFFTVNMTMTWPHPKLQTKNLLWSELHAAYLFIHGNGEGVSYSRHLSSTQLSVEFIVPLWKTTPTKEERDLVLGWRSSMKMLVYLVTSLL